MSNFLMSLIVYPNSDGAVSYSGGYSPVVYNPQSGPVISYSDPGYGQAITNVISDYVTSDNVAWALDNVWNKAWDYFSGGKKNKQPKNKSQQQVVPYQPSRTIPPYTPFYAAPLPVQSLGNKYRPFNIASYWNPGYYDMFKGGGLPDPFLIM